MLIIKVIANFYTYSYLNRECIDLDLRPYSKPPSVTKKIYDYNAARVKKAKDMKQNTHTPLQEPRCCTFKRTEFKSHYTFHPSSHAAQDSVFFCCFEQWKPCERNYAESAYFCLALFWSTHTHACKIIVLSPPWVFCLFFWERFSPEAIVIKKSWYVRKKEDRKQQEQSSLPIFALSLVCSLVMDRCDRSARCCKDKHNLFIFISLRRCMTDCVGRWRIFVLQLFG